MRGLGTAFEDVIADPTVTRFYDAPQTIDLRVEKTARVHRSLIAVYVDALNVTNQGIATLASAVSGPQFGTPLTWSDPRVVRIGLRWRF